MALIAQTLGVKEVTGQAPLDQLKRVFQGKRLVLVLDNFEQVLDAAPLLAELLEACPGLKTLVTSRSALRVRGEQLYAVPPLLLPDVARLPAIGALARTPAVALFVERAHEVRPDFRLMDENAAAVAAICCRLDGLPLAIELAAARIRLLSPQTLVERLEQRLALLTDGARDLPPRHRTLRAAIGWSYELLDASEQMLFRRLGVFVGGWTLEAAEAVCNADGDLPWKVVGGLAALLDKSLLQQNEGPDGELRFTMLETIREYALEQVEARGEAEALRPWHANYFLALAEAVESHFYGAAQLRWADRLELELDNFQAALAWAHKRGTVEILTAGGAEAELRLAGALFWFWALRGYFREGQRWLDGALAQIKGLGHRKARAKALFGAGALASFQGDIAAARSRLEESEALWREVGDKRELALTLTYGGGLGWATLYERHPEVARALFAEGATLWRELSDKWGLAFSLWGLGAAVRRDDPAAAHPILEESVALFREVGDKKGLANALNQLGTVTWSKGDLAQAIVHYAEGLAISRELGDKILIAMTLSDLGDVALYQGDEQRATALYQESLVLSRQESKQGIACSLVGLAGVARAVGQPERVARLLSAVETLLDAIGLSVSVWPEMRADYDRNLAAVRAQLDETTFAAAWAEGRAMPLEQAIAYALNAPAQLQPAAILHHHSDTPSTAR